VADREAFAQRYLPVVRAYLGARWRNGALARLDTELGAHPRWRQ
jgi:hypothetical protein